MSSWADLASANKKFEKAGDQKFQLVHKKPLCISPLQQAYDDAFIKAVKNGHQCGDICENNPYGCIAVGFDKSSSNCHIAVDRRG